MNDTARALRARLTGQPTIGIIGLGYVGLPLAVAFADSGASVIGVDLDAQRVAAIRAGRSFIEDVPTPTLGALVAAGRLGAADDVAALKDCDAIVICVPTPLGKSKEPDISFIVSAADAVAAIIRPGQLVVLESTTYPGTTQEILLPRFEARGIEAGKDFFLAFSPERIDPGNTRYTLRDIPKVVGGLTEACRELVAALYGRITTVVPVSSPETAEMVKLFENTFRSVNIALVNEFAIMSRKLVISVWEVVAAAATKPFGFMPFYPGPGLGGHCIPIDPFYLSWKAKQSGFECRFIELAGHVNGSMPEYVVERISEALNSCRKAINGSRIHLFGIAYKKDVSDMRESPALDILQLLHRRGADLSYTDPYVPSLKEGPVCLRSVAEEAVSGVDCAVIATDHKAFNYANMPGRFPLVMDTRNALKGNPAKNIFRL